MNTKAPSIPPWSTSCYANAPDTSPMELSALGAHLGRCRGARDRLFTLRCLGEAVHGFIAPRTVTTLVFVSTVLVAVAWAA